MSSQNRYSVPKNEDFEPNSNDSVLRNYLKITSKEEMDIIEAKELQRTELELENKIRSDHEFTAEDVCIMHELWLGDIYPFAGRYRTVSMSKDDFTFASPSFISKLMNQFEKNYLKKYTPCYESDLDNLASIIGETHAELIIIHPFREGNGRLSRLLANMMALQANIPQLNYSSIDQINNKYGFNKYIQSIHGAFSGSYSPIKEVFLKILKDSI